MWIYDPDRKCNECGATDTAFFAQKQRKNQITVNNICQPCKAKQRSEYYYKHDKMKVYLRWKKEKK